jgi:phospholipid/cholesterol/gamma-HCH transport system substrate-binding protein
VERQQQGLVLMRRTVRLGRNSILGAVVIGAVAAIVLWGFLGKPNPFSQGTSVWVEFPSAASFARFDREVRVGGADVGMVGEVKRDGDHALVELNFSSNIGTIHADATAAIRPHTLFDGTAFVQFSPGSPEAPPLGNRVVSLAHTQDYVSVSQALSFATAPTRHSLQSVARNLSDTLTAPAAAALRDSFRLSPDLFRQLEPATVALGGPSQTELAGTVRGFAATASALAEAQASYGPLLRDTSATIAAFRTQSDSPLERTLTAFPATLAAAQVGGAALTRTISRLEPLAAALTPAMRELAPTEIELQPLLRAARPVLSSAVPFIGALRSTLSTAQQAAPSTTALVAEFNPLLKNVNRTLLPYLASPSKPGPPIYRALLSFASSADGTLSAVQTPQQSGKDGSGHLWHVFAGKPVGGAGTPPCSAYGNGQLRAVLLELALCSP